MKILNYSTRTFVALAVGVLGLILFFVYRNPIDQTQAKIIAESAFLSTVKHLKMVPNDFESLPLDKPSQDQKVIVFTWQSKAKTECKIEVDVDLIYANARPTWICR